MDNKTSIIWTLGRILAIIIIHFTALWFSKTQAHHWYVELSEQDLLRAEYIECKNKKLDCIHETRKKAKAGEEKKKQQDALWAEYNRCRDWWLPCLQASRNKANWIVEVKKEKISSWCLVDLTTLWSTQDMYANYAMKISNCNKDFIWTLYEENDQFNPWRQSTVINYSWPNNREDARWFCQINRNFKSNVRWKWVQHTTIVNDSRFLNDWKRQMDWCWDLYKERYITKWPPYWATMYWYNKRSKRIKYTIFYNK